jgi:hypothetical protein
LNFSVHVRSTFLNVELIRISRRGRAHDEVSRIVFETLKLCWSILKLEMPLLLLF